MSFHCMQLLLGLRYLRQVSTVYIKTISHLQYFSEVDDPQLHWVRSIPELLQTACLLLSLSITMVLIDLSSVIHHHLDLGIIMLQSSV